MTEDTEDPKECFKLRSRPCEATTAILLLIRLSVQTKQLEHREKDLHETDMSSLTKICQHNPVMVKLGNNGHFI